MQYKPLVKSARRIREYRLAPFSFLLFDEIESIRFEKRSMEPIEYLYLLAVYQDGVAQPCLFVSSEKNATSHLFGGGSHFLGMFIDSGHRNLGSSNDWADLELFTAEALMVATKHLGLSDIPERYLMQDN